MRPPRGGGWRGADGAGDLGDRAGDPELCRPRLANPYDLSTWMRPAVAPDGAGEDPSSEAAAASGPSRRIDRHQSARRGAIPSSASANPLPELEIGEEQLVEPRPVPPRSPREPGGDRRRPEVRSEEPVRRVESASREAPVRRVEPARREAPVRREGPAPVEEPVDPPELPRLDDPFELARRTVNRSRAAARDRGLFPISAKTQARRDIRDRSGRSPGYSGARPDPRDPQGIEGVMRRVLSDLGWNEGMSSGRVLEEWDEIVGDQVAAHCRPVSFEDGVLVVSASSSAWASQLRMITPQIVTSIEKHVGSHVVSEMRVTGPAAAQRSWKKGRRTVTWRGPRDTYG